MIKIESGYFKDHAGRTVMMRGVNLGGNSKTPKSLPVSSYGATDFFSKKKVSFLDRPLPLAQADEHFKRLKHWGFDFVRLVVTWEAIENEEAGVYDEKFLEYIRQLVQKAQAFDIQVIIDPHQDAWSRFSGGSGAPRWTFEVAGLDVTQFAEAGAAVVQDIQKEPLPTMIWITNYAKLAASTMFTLFFGGNHFAPQTKVNGQPIQEYLQEHYIKAFQKLAETLKDLDNVIGFGIMNNPSPGWIGHKDLNVNTFPFKRGAMPTPFQAMALGSGSPLEVEKWDLGQWSFKQKGKIELNSRGVKAWLNGYRCIWKTHEVWNVGKGGVLELLKPDYFALRNGETVNFNQQYLKPFIEKYAQAILEVKPEALIFVDYAMHETPPQFENSSLPLVNAPQWHDFLALLSKNFSSWYSYDIQKGKAIFGKKKIKQIFTEQLKSLHAFAQTHLQNAPSVIASVGIPIDLQKGKAYQKQDFSLPIKALDNSLKLIENLQIGYFIWNYTPDNINEKGDHWNSEDLSIFSKDQQLDKQDINSGGRALKAFLRPYPKKIAGEPMFLAFDIRKQVLEFRFKHHAQIKEPTLIFIPEYQYPSGYKVEISDGNYEMQLEKQLLIYHHSPEREEHVIKITRQV